MEDQDQRAQLRRDAELMEQLVAHPAWVRFCELIEATGSNYFQQLCVPLENALEATKPEYAKGTLNGLQLAARLPRAKIEESKSLRNPNDEEG